MSRTMPKGIFQAACPKALEAATVIHKLRERRPSPYLHLRNLWASRLRDLQKCRKGGNMCTLMTQLNRATTVARRYSKEPYRQRWRGYCTSYNKRTGLSRVWHPFRSMQMKGMTRTESADLATRLRITKKELPSRDGFHSFPQPIVPPHRRQQIQLCT